jgi:2-polyprenyl-3-methyl-5-hydroxy-6-metoxy-1,4-benzoquinol methylase
MAVTNQETDNAAKWERDGGVEARLLARYRRRLLAKIAPLAPRRVLDVGCGEGTLTGWLAAEIDGAEVHGFEAREDAVAEFRERNPELTVHQGDLYALPFEDGTFDLVVALEVLEHLENPAAAAAELRRVSSGHVAVTVPLEPAFRMGNLVRGRYRDRLGSTPGHLHTWGPLGVQRVLRDALPGGRWFELFPWQGYIASVAPAANADGGREALEQHFERWVEESEQDFRTGSLNHLVAQVLKPGRTLDIGCGTGGLSAELMRDGHQVVSQDASPSIADLCRRYLGSQDLPADGVRVGLIEDMDPAERFDSIVALDVIEHIEDDGVALRAMRRAIAPGGRLLLSVPSLSRLYGPKDVAVGHYRRYDRKELVALLEREGFTVESVRYWNAIGVLPVWLTVRVMRTRLDEGFRYGDRSRPQRLLNDILRLWFRHVEDKLRPPAGLTLIACARPTDG